MDIFWWPLCYSTRVFRFLIIATSLQRRVVFHNLWAERNAEPSVSKIKLQTTHSQPVQMTVWTFIVPGNLKIVKTLTFQRWMALNLIHCHKLHLNQLQGKHWTAHLLLTLRTALMLKSVNFYLCQVQKMCTVTRKPDWPNWWWTISQSYQLSTKALLWKKAFDYWWNHCHNCWETRYCQSSTRKTKNISCPDILNEIVNISPIYNNKDCRKKVAANPGYVTDVTDPCY